MSITKEQDLNSSGDITLKDFILKILEWKQFLVSKWIIILIAGIIGGGIGLLYALTRKDVYKAELSFVLQDDKSGGGGLSGALGLASQLGLDVGGGGLGSAFSGDNLIELMKSRLIIEKTFLTPVTINGKSQTLADFYISFNKIREGWKSNPALQNLHFVAGADPDKFSLQQDSVMSTLHQKVIANNISVNKKDKVDIIAIDVVSSNELFSKYFTEVLAKVVSDFYIQTKTEKQVKNVLILQHQTDSVRNILNAAISDVALSSDNNPNPNPVLQILRVPSQRRQVDVQFNSGILSELVKNLEVAKMSKLQETPLIQVIDKPVLPLEKERLGKLKGILVGGIVASFLMICLLMIRRIFKNILNS